MAGSAASSRALGKALFGSLTLSTVGLGTWQTIQFFEDKPVAQKLLVRPKDLQLNKAVWVGPRSGGPNNNKRGFYVYAAAPASFVSGEMGPGEKSEIGSSPSTINTLVCLGWTVEKPFDLTSIRDKLLSNDVAFEAFARGGEKGNRFSPPNPPNGPFLWMDEKQMLLAAQLDPSTDRLAETYRPVVADVFYPKAKPEPYLTKWTHAGYAATWYSLSLAGVVMMRRMFK